MQLFSGYLQLSFSLQVTTTSLSSSDGASSVQAVELPVIIEAKIISMTVDVFLELAFPASTVLW